MLDNKLFWDVLIIISSTIELWGCKKVFDYTSEKKSSNIKINLVMILIVIFMLLLLKINIHPNIRIMVSVILTLVLYITNYSTNISTGIMTTLIYWMVLLGVDGLSMSISIWVNSLDNMGILLMNNTYRLQSIILGKAILIALLCLYRVIKFEIELDKKDIVYLGIPIVTNIVSFFVIFKYVLQFSSMSLINNTQILYISILLFLSNISIILVIRKIRRDSRRLAQKDIMEKNMDMQYNYYMNIRENQVNLRQLHHDIKNHIICMKKLNENGYDNEKYIENIENKLIDYDNIFDTGSVLLDIILNEKKKICDNENITLSGHINFTKCDFIELEDICSIFSNILDNSIEACKKIEKSNRFISIEGRIVEKFFILKAENSKVNKVNIRNNKFITDKKDSFSHGLGISSIKSTVEKYNGETVINYTDEKFTIKLLLPIVLYND
ncbi:MAG: GHKL domain-containing protein [Paraclostridium sp.]